MRTLRGGADVGQAVQKVLQHVMTVGDEDARDALLRLLLRQHSNSNWLGVGSRAQWWGGGSRASSPSGVHSRASSPTRNMGSSEPGAAAVASHLEMDKDESMEVTSAVIEALGYVVVGAQRGLVVLLQQDLNIARFTRRLLPFLRSCGRMYLNAVTVRCCGHSIVE
jgi:hypothetical protein